MVVLDPEGRVYQMILASWYGVGAGFRAAILFRCGLLMMSLMLVARLQDGDAVFASLSQGDASLTLYAMSQIESHDSR